MYKINLICVGNLKDKEYISMCDEYIKRISKFAQINIIELKEKNNLENVSLIVESESKSIEEKVDLMIDDDWRIIKTLSENSISPRYPIVFYMENVSSGKSRTDSLNQLLRTNIAIAFMDRIKQAGYVPMIYGNKEYLLKKISFGSLIGYDVWLYDEGDTPDFPYQYNMWKYTSKGNISGIAGYAKVDISFTDYTIR